MRRDGDFEANYYLELHARYMAASQQYRWDIIDTSNRSREAVAADIGRLLGLATSQTPAGSGADASSLSCTWSEVQLPDAQASDLRRP